MEDFVRFTIGKRPSLKKELSNKIVTLFAEISASYIFEKRNARRPNSNTIKYSLVNLGHELGYRVYANGLSEQQRQEQWEKYKFVCREFLCDVHWYVDKAGKFYILENVILVAESELGAARKGDISKLRNPAIKFDFQKLLIANADLRLMIFKVHKIEHLSELNRYFEEAIREYRTLRKKSCFLFICFVHDSKSLFYCEKYKQ